MNIDDTISTWPQYKAMIDQLVQDRDNFYFRGHANENWKLETTFHREAKTRDISLDNYIQSILPEIQYHIGAMRDELVNLNDEEDRLSFLAMLQHHGFPTPLLDWTRSPYIAAYFAFRSVSDDHPQSEYVRIYKFDYNSWGENFSFGYLGYSDPFISAVKPYAKYNPRVIPQQATFTLTNIPDMEDHIKSFSEVKYLESFLLSVKDKPKVLRDLNIMGINEMSLFPDIEGICRKIKWDFFSPETVGRTTAELARDFLNRSNERKLAQMAPPYLPPSGNGLTDNFITRKRKLLQKTE